jgi:hypothetical protein
MVVAVAVDRAIMAKEDAEEAKEVTAHDAFQSDMNVAERSTLYRALAQRTIEHTSHFLLHA